jgi:hypothetical protein
MDLLPGRWKTRGYDSHFDFGHVNNPDTCEQSTQIEKTSYEQRLEQQKEESAEQKAQRELNKLIQSRL